MMEPVTTVGQLFQLSPSALLQTLDPLLTHGEFIHIIQTNVYRLPMDACCCHSKHHIPSISQIY